MTILRFPEERNLKTQVKDLVVEMSELHDTLRRAYELIYKLEENLEGKEEHYNEVLNRYCNAVGTENVPVEYFEYASEGLHVDADSGDIIFTPWDDEQDDS